jgi:hypothetical protein
VQAGSFGDGGAADEFVEIYNAGSCDVALQNYTIRYASATGSTASIRYTFVAGDHIPPGGYVVVGGQGYPGTPIGRFVGSTGVLAGSGGAVGIFAPDSTRLDSVAYVAATASNPLVEPQPPGTGVPAPNPPADQSISRIPNGRDTDNNGADFQVRTPTPGAAN